MARARPWLVGYLAAVICAGVGVVAASVALDGGRFLAAPGFWAFAVIVVVLESFSIRLPASQDDSEVTTSTTFGYALLLLEGPGAAAVALVAGAVANGVTHRKSWYKTAFNAGQFAVAAAVCGLVLVLTAPGFALLGPPPALRPEHLPGVLLGAVVFIAVNFALLQTVVALAARAPVRAHALRSLSEAAGPMVVMLSVAPVVTVAARESLWFLLLFAVPIVALFKMAEISLAKEHLALHDPLTDLPNRGLFGDRLEQALLADRRQGSGVAVLFLDVDRLHEVNDTLGHAAGDEVLRSVARRLSASVGPTDTVARLGGDEFAAVLRDVDDPSALMVAEGLRDELLSPVTVGGVRLEVPVSIGVVCAQPDDAPDELLTKADTALSRAKTLRLGVAAFDPAVDAEPSPETRDRLALGNQLRAALGTVEIGVTYQPQVHLGDGRIVAVEALARWRHPTLGILGAGRLIPIAESTGLIRALSLHVMREAVAEVGRWRNEHDIDVRVSVNVVAQNLLDVTLPTALEEAVAAAGLQPSDVCLEITEGDILLDPTESLATLRALRDLGVSVAIDDFGTGMSSLSRLKDLPVDELKIDKAFVANLRDKRSLAFVRTIVALGHELDLRIVGEGVENALILEMLSTLGVELAQGYLFTAPLWGRDYPAWHRRWTGGRVQAPG